MEDAYFGDVSKDRHELFAGVYDGHGGDFAANYAREHLHRVFFEELKREKGELEAFKTAYQKISDGLKQEESGTTALNFFIKNETIFYAHAGDTRLIVIGDYGVKQLTRDHRITEYEERRRILERGGVIVPPYVYKKGYGLMVTRSLGDEYFKDVGVIALPDVGYYRLSPVDKWIIGGTDGLFDVVDNESILELIEKCPDARGASEILKREVLFERGGSDNLTFVVVRINMGNTA